MRKAAKQDKEDWMDNTLREAAQDDDVWEGMQTISRDYKPT